jgi:peptidoglycan/LPS O-acetylase OafA/YrhL
MIHCLNGRSPVARLFADNIAEPEAPVSAASDSPFQPSYFPFLDGLRAVSILMVLGFHQLGPFTGWLGTRLNGWVGVDLFFIISGFLITFILLKERARRGTFSLRNFYIRRWLRICPAFYAFLTFMFVWMLCRGEHYYSSFAVAGLYLTNVDLGAGWGLCVPAACLLHTWSLSVEEQFYLVWPGLLKLAGNRALRICLFLIAAAYFWRLYLVSAGAGWLRISTGLDTKLDSIMLGVAVALLWSKSDFQAKARQFFGAPIVMPALLIILGVACFLLGHPGTETQPWFFWGFKLPLVLVLLTTLMLGLLSAPGCAAARLLSTKFLVWTGRLSYSLYLWHVVVNFPCTDAIMQTLCHHRRYLVELGKYASCFAFAAGSYYLIEKPFLNLKSKFS